MSGQSGVACMDAMARELIETGYLHNHARMWWASFWIHVERLPWELGADFFFRHLLDADPASNTLSWRWVAGLQTPGKTYLVRLSNIQKYAPHYLDGNPLGLARLEDSAAKAQLVTDSADRSPRPLAALPGSFASGSSRVGLWLHPDDLSPEQGPLERLMPASVAACVSDGVYRERYALSQGRIESLRVVLQDGLNRAQAHFQCPGERLETRDPASALVEWAQRFRLDQIVTFAPMVGPIGDWLGLITRRLEGTGIRLTLIRRPSDTFAFSLAHAGFFPFWEKMSRHLAGVWSR
jgi:deoxyribodipyrimidine photo-lyase